MRFLVFLVRPEDSLNLLGHILRSTHIEWDAIKKAKACSMKGGRRIWEYLPIRKKKAPGDKIASLKYSKAYHLEEGQHLFSKAPGQSYGHQVGVRERQHLIY